jgi:hypothetical protein
MTKTIDNIKKNKTSLIVLAIIIIIYMSIAIVFKNTNYLYEKDTKIQMDRINSYDEMYYSRVFFSSDLENILNWKTNIVKHPGLTYFGFIYSSVEETIFPSLSNDYHYFGIICLQIIISLIGGIFIYKILSEILKLNQIQTIILSTIYLLSNTVILSTFLAESFIYSGTLLVIAYYYLAKQRPIIGGIIGSLIFGVTITNLFIWGIMVIFLMKEWKKIAITLIVFILINLLFILIINAEYRDILLNSFFSVINNNATEFTNHLGIMGIIKYGFYFMGCSSIFYIDTINTNQLGTEVNHAISFIPSANVVIVLLTIVWILFVVYMAIKNIKDRNILACIFILFFNCLLHVVKQFGLIESYLYSLHYFFAEIIIIGFGLKLFKNDKKAMIFLIVLLMFEIIFNFNGFKDLYYKILEWKYLS